MMWFIIGFIWGIGIGALIANQIWMWNMRQR